MKGPAPRLGRGLAALFGDAGLGPNTERPVASLAVRLLTPGPFQPRLGIDEASLTELADSIRQQGVLQPILVRPHPSEAGRFQIIAGERRWRACQLAGLVDIPVLIRALSDRDAMAAALVENLQRQDLNPIEEAEGYVRLSIDYGMSHDQLGELLGKSRSHIANTIRLLQLDNSVKELVKDGSLSAGHARALLMHPDQTTAAAQVIAGRLNVRQTEALQRPPVKKPIKNIEARGYDPDTAALEEELSKYLGLQVQVRRVRDRGTLTVRFASTDQLEGLKRLLKPH